ncbi:hypothetical protein NMY22_g4875 [Coprinellus aureogranulatus]|nr:hypothetical protein NMY22_g4875 [Coprinellus aureogranulatus]
MSASHSALDALLGALGPAVPFKEVLAGTREGSILHFAQLRNHVSQRYARYGQDILDAISVNLAIPPDGDVLETITYSQIGIALNAILALTRVSQWYTANKGGRHSVPVSALVSRELSERYLFWALRLIRIPDSLPLVNAPIRLALYDAITSFFRHLFDIPNIRYEDLQEEVKSAMSDVAVAWWTCLIDGEPPIYPSGRRGGNGPYDDSTDDSTELLSKLYDSDKQSKDLAAAIMNGAICSPQTFVERTLGRMRAFGRLQALNHLSHFPPETFEGSNMSRVVGITNRLILCDAELYRLFLENGTPGVYLKVLSSLGESLEEIVTAGALPGESDINPGFRECIARYIGLLLISARYVLTWAYTSDSNVLQHMKDGISNGAVELVRSGIVLRSSEVRGELDDVFDILGLYAPYVKVFPDLFEKVTTHVRPHYPPPSEKLRGATTGLQSASTYRSVSIGHDIECLDMMAQFSDKSHRERLCDNLNHWGSNAGQDDSKLQSEYTCSFCRSVVYCSARCQKEDWHALHRAECHQMYRDYVAYRHLTERRCRHQSYSYHDRSFQSSMLRYAYESLLPTSRYDGNHDGVPPYAMGREGVTFVDLFRPACIKDSPNLDAFVESEYGRVPAHLRPRFSTFMQTFIDTNGFYRGDDPDIIRTQKSRLLFHSFRFGNKDVNLLLLLQRVRWTTAWNNPTTQYDDALKYRYRGPEAKPEYVIQAALAYMSDNGSETRPSRVPASGLRYAIYQRRVFAGCSTCWNPTTTLGHARLSTKFCLPTIPSPTHHRSLIYPIRTDELTLPPILSTITFPLVLKPAEMRIQVRHTVAQIVLLLALATFIPLNVAWAAVSIPLNLIWGAVTGICDMFVTALMWRSRIEYVTLIVEGVFPSSHFSYSLEEQALCSLIFQTLTRFAGHSVAVAASPRQTPHCAHCRSTFLSFATTADCCPSVPRFWLGRPSLNAHDWLPQGEPALGGLGDPLVLEPVQLDDLPQQAPQEDDELSYASVEDAQNLPATQETDLNEESESTDFEGEGLEVRGSTESKSGQPEEDEANEAEETQPTNTGRDFRDAEYELKEEENSEDLDQDASARLEVAISVGRVDAGRSHRPTMKVEEVFLDESSEGLHQVRVQFVASELAPLGAPGGALQIHGFHTPNASENNQTTPTTYYSAIVASASNLPHDQKDNQGVKLEAPPTPLAHLNRDVDIRDPSYTPSEWDVESSSILGPSGHGVMKRDKGKAIAKEPESDEVDNDTAAGMDFLGHDHSVSASTRRVRYGFPTGSQGEGTSQFAEYSFSAPPSPLKTVKEADRGDPSQIHATAPPIAARTHPNDEMKTRFRFPKPEPYLGSTYKRLHKVVSDARTRRNKLKGRWEYAVRSAKEGKPRRTRGDADAILVELDAAEKVTLEAELALNAHLKTLSGGLA